MKTDFVLVAAMMTLNCFLASANEQIEFALGEVLKHRWLSNRRTEASLEEWGAPQRLFDDQEFTNLVSVMRRELVNCDFQYVNGLTGIVKRTVFAAALTKCGESVYHDSVVRWFGGCMLPPAVSVDVWQSVLFPIGTNMEDYMDTHFDSPGISNVLTNARRAHCAAGNSNDVAAIDWILSGEAKASKVNDVENGLLDRIRDGSSE